MKAYVAIAVALLFISAMAVQPAMAMVTSIPFIYSGCAVFAEPLSSTALTVLEFNSQSTNISDMESLDINFPVFADGVVAGPATGDLSTDGLALGGSANILPFGPVNLAFPSIAQTVDASCASQRTYFFTDTFS